MKTNIIANNSVINTIMRNVVKYLCAVLLFIGMSTSAWADNATYYVWDSSTNQWAEYVVQDENATVVAGPDALNGKTFIGWHIWNPDVYPNWKTGGSGYIQSDGEAYFTEGGEYSTKYIRYIPNSQGNTAEKNTGKNEADNKFYAVYSSGSTDWTKNAGWSASSTEKVTITFNANGGTGTMATQTVLKNTTTFLQICEFQAPAGKTFAGWATSSGGAVVYSDQGEVRFSENQTLYAKWQDGGTYTVVYNLTGVTVTSGPTTVTNSEDALEVYFSINSGYTSEGIYGKVCVEYNGTPWCYDTNGGYNIEFVGNRLDYVNDGNFTGNVVITITAQESACTPPTVAFGSGVNHTVTIGASGWTDAATVKVGGSSTGQTISYSSSNSSVASVNSSTGAVTIGSAAGTATITATAASNATYCEATASYTVMVNPNVPTVSATETGKELTATPTSPTAATIYGATIMSYGGGTVTAHGFVYGTNHNPTLRDNVKTWNQSRKIGKAFGNQYPSGLTPGATYYVRAYATNEAGTGYSTEISFTMPMAYTITLNNQSATTAGTESIEVWADDDHNLTGTPAITLPTKTGYAFGGYYTAVEGGGTQIIDAGGNVNASAGGGSTYTDASKNWKYGNDIELYAKWTAQTYMLSLDNQSPTTESTPTSVTVTYGASTNLTGTVVTTLPTKTGYSFGGYYTGTSGSGVQLITDAGIVNASVSGYTDGDKKWIYNDNVTVYAKWTANEIKLVLSANGGEHDGSAIVLYDATGLKPATLKHAVYDGHNLVGYYAEAGHTTKVLNSDGSFAATDVSGYITDGKWSRTTTPTELYAFWAAEIRTVTFDKQGHGGDNLVQEVEYNTPVVRPTPDPNDIDYKFEGWYDEAACRDGHEWNFNTNITANTTIYAKWSEKEYENLIFACVDLNVVTEDGDPALITSRNGINVMATKKLKVTVSGALEGHAVKLEGSDTDLKFYKNDGTRFIELTNADAAHTLVAPLDQQEVYVSYAPSAAGTTGAITSADITVKCDGFEETFSGKVKVRNLPNAVTIVAKVGNTYQALPANIASASNPAPVMVSVAVADGVNKASGPSTVSYKLWSVASLNSPTHNDRWGTSTASTPGALYGDRLRFAGNSDKALWANNSASKNTISDGVGAIDEVGDYFDNDPGYEWIVTTTEVGGEFVYTLTTDQTNNTNNLRLWGSKWGTYGSSYGIAEVYILPLIVTETADVTVMEWGTDQIAVKYANAGTVASGTFKARIGAADQTTVTCTSLGGDIYKLTGVGALQSNPAKALTLNMTETSTPKQAVFAIPLIVTASKTEAELCSYAAGGNGSTLITEGRAIAKGLDVVIRSGGTLTTGTAQGKFANLFIYPGGKAEITNNIGFGNIYLRGGFSWLDAEKDYRLPQMKVDEDLTIDGVQQNGNGVYYDLYLDKRRYYMMAVPKDVSLESMTNEEGGDDATIWLKQYSGKGRTQTPKTSGWVNISGSKLLRGVGYEMSIKPRNAGAMNGRTIGILRMPLLQSTAWTNEGECMPAVKAWGYNDENVYANNKGWNFIGNPYFTAFQVSAADGTVMEVRDMVHHEENGQWTGTWDWTTSEDVKYVTIPQKMYDDYTDVRALNYKLESFYPFFIQAKLDGNLTFTGSPVLKAPSILRAKMKEREVMIDFMLTDANGTYDQAGLTVGNEYSADFDMEDKEKTIVNENYLKVYTMVGEYRTAFNSLPEAVAELPIPVGYIAPIAGQYTFALTEGNYSEVEHVWLTDYETSSTVDLLEDVYEFETAKGMNNARLVLNIILKPETHDTPTEVEEIDETDNGPTKFIYHDKMFIKQNGVIYDATGKKVK